MTCTCCKALVAVAEGLGLSFEGCGRARGAIESCEITIRDGALHIAAKDLAQISLRERRLIDLGGVKTSDEAFDEDIVLRAPRTAKLDAAARVQVRRTIIGFGGSMSEGTLVIPASFETQIAIRARLSSGLELIRMLRAAFETIAVERGTLGLTNDRAEGDLAIAVSGALSEAPQNRDRS